MRDRRFSPPAKTVVAFRIAVFEKTQLKWQNELKLDSNACKRVQIVIENIFQKQYSFFGTINISLRNIKGSHRILVP